jgi:hypothetical protein
VAGLGQEGKGGGEGCSRELLHEEIERGRKRGGGGDGVSFYTNAAGRQRGEPRGSKEWERGVEGQRSGRAARGGWHQPRGDGRR